MLHANKLRIFSISNSDIFSMREDCKMCSTETKQDFILLGMQNECYKGLLFSVKNIAVRGRHW